MDKLSVVERRVSKIFNAANAGWVFDGPGKTRAWLLDTFMLRVRVGANLATGTVTWLLVAAPGELSTGAIPNNLSAERYEALRAPMIGGFSITAAQSVAGNIFVAELLPANPVLINGGERLALISENINAFNDGGNGMASFTYRDYDYDATQGREFL